jgi:hypothetical protein
MWNLRIEVIAIATRQDPSLFATVDRRLKFDLARQNMNSSPLRSKRMFLLTLAG